MYNIIICGDEPTENSLHLPGVFVAPVESVSSRKSPALRFITRLILSAAVPPSAGTPAPHAPISQLCVHTPVPAFSLPIPAA